MCVPPSLRSTGKKYVKQKMRKRILSFALALILCLSLLPATALAAEEPLPDWYFLFAVFKNVDADYMQNDIKKHTKYSMTQDEIDFVKGDARDFEEFMNQVGVIRVHVEVVEIDATITELADYGDTGGWLSTVQDAPLLAKSNIDLDRYDHVTCIASLNDHMGYLGLGGSSYENGTGHSFVNLCNREYYVNTLRATEKEFPPSIYVHEFLHFMERMNQKWGAEFGLHLTGDRIYSSTNTDNWKTYYTDALLNRVNGDSETGTGVHPMVWQYPPHVLRTMTELTVPSGVTAIGEWAFGDCDSLAEVTIPASVTRIGYAAFWNTSLTDVYYGGTEAQWETIKIDDYNEALTKANIHYNGGVSTQQPATAAPTNDKLTVNSSAADPTVYKIDGNNYFKIRDVAALLNGTEKQFAVGYDNTTKSATATTGQSYTRQDGDLSGAATGGNQSATPSNDAIYVDAQKIDVQVYKIGGSNYFKLRDLGKALDFCVGWSREQGMFIDTNKPYTE